MANTSFTQQALAVDSSFRLRLTNALAKVSWEVLNEDENTLFHDARAAYARVVLGNLDSASVQQSSSIVTRTNLFAFETSLDPNSGHIVTAAGDADIESQLATDWNDLAGV